MLKVRMEADIQVLDPGYMIGGAETSIQYACLPRLPVPVKKGDAWDWAPSDYVEKITQDDPTHISFTLKPGLKWSGDSWRGDRRGREILARAHARNPTGRRAIRLWKRSTSRTSSAASSS